MHKERKRGQLVEIDDPPTKPVELPPLVGGLGRAVQPHKGNSPNSMQRQRPHYWGLAMQKSD